MIILSRRCRGVNRRLSRTCFATEPWWQLPSRGEYFSIAVNSICGTKCFHKTTAALESDLARPGPQHCTAADRSLAKRRLFLSSSAPLPFDPSRCLRVPSSCSKPRGRALGTAGQQRRRCDQNNEAIRLPASARRAPWLVVGGARCYRRSEQQHGEPDSLPQLRWVQLFAAKAGAFHAERTASENPQDPGQG